MAFDVGAIVARLELDKKKWEQSIAAVKKDQTSLQGFVLRNEQQIKSLGRTLTIAGAAVTGMFGLLIKGAVGAGDYINDLSKRTGIGTETLSAYKLAADKSGTSLEGLAIGMRGLANQMQAANSGGKEGQKIFKALGVEYIDNTGKLRPLDQVMLDVADRFAMMEDGAQKTALAQDIFGRSGMELIPMLNMGRKGLEENAEAAHRLGVVWSTEAARKADEFNDSMAELKAGLAGTGREIATALMPMVKSLIEKVRDIAVKVREWIAEHPTLTSWITKLTAGVGLLMGTVGPLLIALPKMIKGFQALKSIDIAGHIRGISLAQAASIGVWTAATSALLIYIGKLGELRDAENYVGIADQRLQEVENKQIETLSKAAVAAGWHYGEMSKLIEAYDGNIAALMMAIQRGKEGKDIQEALARVSREEAKEIDNLRKKIEGESDALKGETEKAREKITVLNTLIPSHRQLNNIISQAPGIMEDEAYGFQTVADAARNMNGIIEQVPGAFDDMAYAAGEMTEDIQSFMQEVSTVISDSVRDIAKSVVGLFNFKKLFGAVTIDVKFDSSAFDGMVKAANSAYDKITDASRRAFDKQELQISRAEEDEDIRYRRKYDREREAIQNSNRTQEQKDAMLKALEIKYEDAKLARERAREDAKYAREEIQAKKLLQLQWDHEADLDKIRKAEDLARQKLADDELKRQDSLWFKVKGIFATACENMATIFLTKMFEPVGNLIGKLAGKLIGKGTDTVGGALDGVGGKVGNLGKTIGDFISGIGTGIGGFISGLATGIATAITTLATAIASAATILAAAIVPLAIIGAFAVALYAAFKLVGAIIDKISGSGGNANITYWLKLIWENTTNLLNWTIGGITAQLETFVKAPMVEKFDALKASLDLTRDQMIPRLDKIVEYTSLLKKIQFGQHGLDTTVSRPTMFMAGERGPERVTISPNFRISSTPIHVHVHMDGKQIALVTAKYAPELSRDGALKIHERGLIRN